MPNRSFPVALALSVTLGTSARAQAPAASLEIDCVAVAMQAVPVAVPAWTVRLTLDEAIARATARSHRIEEMRARESGTEAAVAGRDAAARPLVAVLGGYTRTNHVQEFGVPLPDGGRNVIFPDIPDNYRARLDMHWPIYTGGRLEALTRAARAESAAAGSDVATTRGDVRLEVVRAYWSTVMAGETVRVVEASTRQLDAHLAAVRSRFDAGLIPPNDVLSVEAQQSRQQLLLLEARNTASNAESDLRRLVGTEAEAGLELDTAAAAPAPAASLDVLIAEARLRRPDRMSLQHRVDAAALRRSASAAARRPSVAVTGGLDYARPNPRLLPRRDVWDESWDLGVQASWTLWDSGRARADAAEAASAERAARHRLQEFDGVLAVDVGQRRLDLDFAIAAIAVAADGTRSAAEARRVVANRFDAGVATSLDVLDAQVAWLHAQLDSTRAMTNARLAQARLERALGR